MNESVLREPSEHLWRDRFPHIGAGNPEAGAGMSRERKLATYEEDLWWLGWSDGGSGQPPDEGIELIARHARARRRLKLSDAQRDLAEAEARHEAAKEIAESVKETLDRHQGELRDAEARRRQDPHEVSIVTGLLYVVVALVLILADIPLSLRLVADGFRMSLDHELENGYIVTFGDIFTAAHRADAIRYLWEPVVLALGIAALGIFFKLVSDYLLSTAPMFDRTRWWWRWSLNAAKVAFFCGAFMLMVYGLICVGFLRADRQAAALEAQAALSASGDSEPAASAPPPSNATPPAGAAANPPAIPKVNWADRSFVIMAIAFPLIGGICFSIGWRRLQQSLRLKWLELSCFVTRWWLHRKRVAAAIAAATKASFSQQLEQLQVAIAGEEEVMPTSVYLHGYRRGFTAPQRTQAHRTFYGRCREMVHHWIAQGMQEENLRRVQRSGGKP